jgi:hypothetical protein
MPEEEIGLDRTSRPAASKSTRADSKESGNASFQVQREFFNALQQMNREWIACATAEFEIGLKLSKN